MTLKEMTHRIVELVSELSIYLQEIERFHNYECCNCKYHEKERWEKAHVVICTCETNCYYKHRLEKNKKDIGCYNCEYKELDLDDAPCSSCISYEKWKDEERR